jgi:transcriptional regulator with XRE-family HTH domain
MRQEDVAIKARLSRTTVARAERGHLESVGLRNARRIGEVLEVRIELLASWRGGELPRLLNERHAALHDAILALFSSYPDWELVPEASFSVFGERGIVDLIAWHAQSRTLLVIELKTEFVDVGGLVGTVDRYRRLGPMIVRDRGWRPTRVGLWVVVADTRTNRRHLALNARLLRAAFPADGRRMRSWLRAPDDPVAALSFMPYGQEGTVRQQLTAPKRVPRARRTA